MVQTVSGLRKKDRRLTKLSLFFFKRPRFTAVFWLVLLAFGIACYTTLMGRQGFPPVHPPISIINGSYLVNDAQKVDEQVTGPISAVAIKQGNVKTISATANASTFMIIVQYKDGTEPKSATKKLQDAVDASNQIPKAARVNILALDVGKFNPQGEGFDMLIAVYGPSRFTDTITDKAQEYSDAINAKKLSLVASTKVLDPFFEGTNPQTGQHQKIQTSFDRYGERVNGQTVFHKDVVIGLKAKDGADAVKLYKQVTTELNSLNKNSKFSGYTATSTAAFAPQIEQEINELQRTLLEGLLAVLIIGTILISLRASILIVLSLATVIATTLGVLYVIGYTLNVITLFSIILGLALIVDDTIIMTEALDVERRRQKNILDTIKASTNKVSLAMLAATTTAILAFAPIAFVGGILGSFIRPIPITIITSLVISLFVALIVIPFLARSLLLRKKHLGPKADVPITVRAQESFARKLTASLRWAKPSRKRLWINGFVALVVGFGFIFGGAYIFKYLTFNIFPSNKDSNQLMVTMQFKAGTDIAAAQAAADKADAIIAQGLGSNFERLSYYATGTTNEAQIAIDIIPYDKRSITAPQLVDKLKDRFKGFSEATVTVGQQDTGGPAGAFSVLIETPDRAAAEALAHDMVQFLTGKSLTRIDGSQAHITKALILNPDAYLRQENKQAVQVSATFDGTDTSTLVTLAKDLVKKEYTNQKLSKYHLNTRSLVYDFGFENENQQSFNSMLIAFPILLAIMYLLLAFEFKSLLQPLLIFFAIPFSFFGVTGGLWLTDNPFSFFTMLGFFALIGLSIKNTILLTDYANQARQAGFGRVDAIVSALEERFRPLLATSLTAIFSLLPLALISPFWESLAFTLIFGLISSTTLVILVFPYYYLGAEYLRAHIGRRMFFSWLIVNAIVLFAAKELASSKAIPLAFIVLNLVVTILKIVKHKTRHKKAT